MYVLGLSFAATAQASAQSVDHAAIRWQVALEPVGTSSDPLPFSELPASVDPGQSLRVRAVLDWSFAPGTLLWTTSFDGAVFGASPGDQITNVRRVAPLPQPVPIVATYFRDLSLFKLDPGGEFDTLPPGQGLRWNRFGSSEEFGVPSPGITALEFTYTFGSVPGTRTFSQVFQRLASANIPNGHFMAFSDSGRTVVWAPPTTIHEARVTVLPAPATLLVLAAAPLAHRRRR